MLCFSDHPVVIKLKNLVGEDTAECARRIISHGYWNLGRIETVNYEEESDCTACFYQNQVKLYPEAWQKPEELVYILLHEFGHVVQYRSRTPKLTDRLFPTLSMNDEKFIGDRPWLRKTKKYMLEYISYEHEAWNEGIKLAMSLSIELDDELYWNCKHKCMRRDLTYLTSLQV
jgi:hypothetical protein